MPPSAQRQELLESFDTDVEIVLAESAEAARAALRDADCVVVEDTLPDFGPEDILDAVAERHGVRQLPVVLFNGGGPPTGIWAQRRGGFALAEAGSMTELRMLAALWLHRSAAAMSEDDCNAIERLLGQRHSLRAGRR
jgi:hypothetical protein